MPPGSVLGRQGTARAHSSLGAEHLGEQLAAAIDDLGLIDEMIRGVHEPEYLDHPPNAVQSAQGSPESGQQRETSLPGRIVTALQIQVLPRPVPPSGNRHCGLAVPGEIGQIPGNDHRPVDSHRRGSLRQVRSSSSSFFSALMDEEGEYRLGFRERCGIPGQMRSTPC